MTTLTTLTCAALSVLSISASAAGGEKLTMPDFTKGGSILANAKHDWNLGATGLRGWIFCDTLMALRLCDDVARRVCDGDG